MHSMVTLAGTKLPSSCQKKRCTQYFFLMLPGEKTKNRQFSCTRISAYTIIDPNLFYLTVLDTEHIMLPPAFKSKCLAIWDRSGLGLNFNHSPQEQQASPDASVPSFPARSLSFDRCMAATLITVLVHFSDSLSISPWPINLAQLLVPGFLAHLDSGDFLPPGQHSQGCP
jgi:hypothetical protein